MTTTTPPTPPSSSAPLRTWPRWHAHLTHRPSGRFLLRRQVKAPDLRSAEEAAIALTAFDLRANPADLTVTRLAQLR